LVWRRPTPLHAEIEELQQTLDDLAERLALTTAYVETLEQAAQSRERLAALIGG
jgi:prefoldin subunit 5